MKQKITGIAYPLRREQSQLAVSHGDQRIRERILCLLSIRPGEQVMQRDFGCDLYRFVHQPLSEAMQPLISFQVQQALARWVPEVRLENCDVAVDRERSALLVTIIYTILREQKTDRLQIELPQL